LQSDLDDLHRRDDEDGLGGSSGKTGCTWTRDAKRESRSRERRVEMSREEEKKRGEGTDESSGQKNFFKMCGKLRDEMDLPMKTFPAAS
jgi:hypothetical protein